MDEAGIWTALSVDLSGSGAIRDNSDCRTDCRCPACGAKTRAAFPDGVKAPVQYGTRIGAFVLYLLHYQLLPEKRLVELLADLLGVKLVTARPSTRACGRI